MSGIKKNLFVMLLVAIPLVLGALTVQKKIVDNAHTETGRILLTVRNTTHQAIKTWFKDQKAAAVAWADAPKIRESAKLLLALSPRQSSLLNSPAQQELRAWHQRIKKVTHYRGYFIVGPNHINLASSRDQNIGVENLLVEQQKFLAGIWQGKPAISLPTKSDVPLTDHRGRLTNGLLSMFVAAPIRNDAGKVIAIFMFRIDPDEGFTNILNQGRIGNSGETYAFDGAGRLISQSRFDDQLHKLGLIQAGERGILNIQLRDPEVNLLEGELPTVPLDQRPLTFMAHSAVQGEAGINLSGYRDYRGVPVVGAWVWNPDLGLGIATKFNVREAYATLRATQLAIITLTVFILFLLIGVTVIYSLYRQRKQAEEARRANEQYNRMLFDESSIGLALCRMNGDLVDINPAYAAILGRTIEETLTLSYWDITPEKYAAEEHAQLEQLNKTGHYGPYEKEYIHADGHLVPVRLSGQILEKDEEKFIWSSVEDITEYKQAEAALRRAATVFDNTDEGIIVTNTNAEMILVNKAFSSITGYTPEEVLGKNPRSQQSGRHNASFYKSMWDTLIRDNQWRGEIWNRRKNGEVYPAWENINIVKDEQGHITNYVAIFSDISVLKESEERMTYLAHHDTLTGLPNRLRFIANLEQAIESAKRHKHKVALMFLDLDRFKSINDLLGHNAGDQLLKIIADRLKSCIRAEDTVARMGGDEFMVVLTEVVKAEDAGLIADKIVTAVRKPVSVSDDTIETSASIGISIYPDDADNSENMVNAADTAMYHAKALGKNNFQYFTAKLASQTLEHAQIEKDLRKALVNNEFELCYQPQLDLNNGKISGVEALIRWNHPVRKQMLPETFIPVADDSELIDSISEWILRKALGDHEKWSDYGVAGPRIAVNITGRQFTRERSIKRILNILEKLAPEPNILQFDLEITESALKNAERTINIINTLKRHGVMFAVDNFGTGHSSPRLLKQLPIDSLKIDQSFIYNISNDGDDQAITAAIIAMAHTLNLRVIGEGVETRSQFDALRALDCDEIQGFYFSKPVSADEITHLLNKSFK